MSSSSNISKYYILGFIVTLVISFTISNRLPALSLVINLLFILASILLYLILYYRIYSSINSMDPNKRGRMGVRGEGMIFTLIFLILVFMLYYWILGKFLDRDLALLFSGGLLFITFRVFYHFAGKEERERLARKQSREREFVKSLKPENNTCLSCFQKMDGDDRFCTNCGFDNSIRSQGT